MGRGRRHHGRLPPPYDCRRTAACHCQRRVQVRRILDGMSGTTDVACRAPKARPGAFLPDRVRRQLQGLEMGEQALHLPLHFRAALTLFTRP